MSDWKSQLLGMAKETEVVRSEIVRAPFGYLGGKTKDLPQILPHLPYRESYIEPFGGSGAVLLARQPSPIDVYNDRWGGVVAFYRVIKDEAKLKQLVELLELSIKAREEWQHCHDTYEAEQDDVVRAYKWFYMIRHSFSSQGRHYGRACYKGSGRHGALLNKLEGFGSLHNRLKNVQIENQDWRHIMADFDGPDAVFYVDPPYLETTGLCYKHNITEQDHRDLIAMIQRMKGFVALSGFPNRIYDDPSINWTQRLTWTKSMSTTGQAFRETNNQSEYNQKGLTTCLEVLWIKEAS